MPDTRSSTSIDTVLGPARFRQLGGWLEHPSLAALRHTTPSLLPEPLQWCAITLALGAANLLDGLTNRRVPKV